MESHFWYPSEKTPFSRLPSGVLSCLCRKANTPGSVVFGIAPTPAAPEKRVADDFQKKVTEVPAARDAEKEKQIRIFCHGSGNHCDKRPPEKL